MLESQASVDRSAMRSAIERLDRMQGKLVTTLAKLQAAKGRLMPSLTTLNDTPVTGGRARLLCRNV